MQSFLWEQNDVPEPTDGAIDSTHSVEVKEDSVEVKEGGLIEISQTFHPAKNDGYALIDNVSTTKGKKLLHEMNLLFPEGSVTAILGPSGAGKSTLLSILTDSLSTNSNGKADSKSSSDRARTQLYCMLRHFLNPVATLFCFISPLAWSLVICTSR